MLAIIGILTLLQLVLAATQPARFLTVTLLLQTIPWYWNDPETMIETPVGRLNVSAIQLFGLCLVSVVAIINRPQRSAAPLRQYGWHAAFLVCCVLSLSYAPSFIYGLRMLAKLAGPLLFMVAATTSLNSERELRSAHNAILGSGVILAAMAFVARALGINSDPNVAVTGMSGLGPPGMGPPVFAAHMLPVTMLSLATYVRERRGTMLLMTLLSAGCVLGALQRTTAAALFVGIAVVLFIGTKGVSRLILPIAGVVALPLLLIFNSSFRRRMFFDASDPNALLQDPSAAFAQINSSGRFGLWDEVLGRFFVPHRALGSGIGATQHFLQGQSQAGLGVVHSEYVRLLCEVGIVGLILFSLAIMFYFAGLVRSCLEARRSKACPADIYALAGIGSLVTYLIYMSTDNAFDYVNQFGIYVFALVAMAGKTVATGAPTSISVPTQAAPKFANLIR